MFSTCYIQNLFQTFYPDFFVHITFEVILFYDKKLERNEVCKDSKEGKRLSFNTPV